MAEETSEAGTLKTPDRSAYDVFVSFRGPDTRYDIADFLYVLMKDKGICVFRDTEEIRLAEEIGDELRRAIPESRIYVVVFSRGYASSVWCLRELAMMVNCRREPASRKVILPIFYDVSPSDVKLKSDLYRDALQRHREKYMEEDVKMWEEALKEVGGIHGLEYKRDKGKGEFVSAVVADILNMLKIKDRILLDHLVGMDDRVENVMGLLNLSSHVERRVVMLHGMGGIGKTTLANVIFNRISSRFDGCCFLADVRESFSTGVGGVERLQEKLLNGIFGKLDGKVGDSSDGLNEIQRRLRNRRVLIIFDDVSESSQLERLVGNFDFVGPGTIIVITTRDKSVCEGLMRHSDAAYEVEGMSDHHALQLFSRRAFRRELPPDDFVDLSKRVLRMTGNLPLALEVIGGHLYRKEKNKWEDTLEKLERVPHKEVMNKLQITYDDLEESEKQIFLDIACFGSEVMPREYASYMWEACGYFPKSGLDVLQDRSLIKVLNVDQEHSWRRHREKYWMHDLIREMGMEIGKQSRLWDPPELALHVIRQQQGTHQVSAMDLQRGYDRLFSGKEFKGMSNLRFLNLSELFGEFRNFPKNLLWLCWGVWLHPRPNADSFKMDNLVVLQIYGGGITDDFIKYMGSLEELSLHSWDISSALKLPSSLRKLNLQGCWWPLRSGTSLDAHDNMGNMSDPPVRLSDFGSLRKLRSLDLSCYERIDFSGVERMELLEELRVSCCGNFVSEVADLSNLSRLKRVSFPGCHSLVNVPRMVGDCHLIISGCMKLESFAGPYRQYHNKRKTRRTAS